MRQRLLLVSLLVLVSLGIVMASQGDAVTDPTPSPRLDDTAVTFGVTDGAADDALSTPVKQGGGPPSADCCDPALEPGVGGNPLCFEGHTCCPGGWQCNNPDGTPACSKPGEVCPDGCASVGEACLVDSDCCFNKCKGGKCR